MPLRSVIQLDNTPAGNKNSIIEPINVTPADCKEYETRSGLVGICAILERRGLIKIVDDLVIS
jgi:hypothetical protein